jgi:hypothetical protein
MRMQITSLLCLLAVASSSSAAEFFVSPTGDDSNPGSKARPFASLERARDEVRKEKQVHPDRDYTVQLRGGIYHLKSTVVFSLADSAAPGRTVTYKAYRDEKPVFSSGRAIDGWRKEGKFWIADMPEGLKPFLTLYDAAGRLQRARGPAFAPTMTYKDATNVNLDYFTLPFPPGALKNWPNLGDVDIVIRPSIAFEQDILPLASVDEATGRARTAIASGWPMTKVRWGLHDINTKGAVWVENVLDYLNGPGQWVANTQERMIYLWPRGEKPENIEAPQLTELIRVEGNIDYDGPRDEPVRGLRFVGLSFTRGDRWPWEKDRAGQTLQHDWEMFDRPTALVRLRGAEGISFEHCHWFDSGGAGVRLDLHAISNRVTDSVIEHLGGTGVLLAGYGPGTKNVNRNNEISRNHIHHVGEILEDSAAIAIAQSGENHIAHNLIHDLNYTGITVTGCSGWNRSGRGDGGRTIRWREIEAAGGPIPPPGPGHRPEWRLREPFLLARNNVIERNEIHDVMQKLWDGDAIYLSGTGRSNWIRENFIHDCLSEDMCEGIRCDADQNETVIERNVILRNGGIGTGISINGRNYAINNFIVDPTGFFLPRGMISMESVPVTGSIVRHNILFTTKPGLRPMFLKNIEGGPDPRFSDVQMDFNLFWHTKDPKWAETHLAEARKEGAELHSRVGDPLFRDPDKGDFRFKRGSPAPALGIEPIDLRDAGLH